MKGLIVKDIEIMKLQKNFLLIMVISAICMSMLSVYTMIIFMCYMFASLAIGTIGYDEYDNGMSYIMSLPIRKGDYAREKFLLTFITVMLGFIVGIIAAAVMMIIGNSFDMVTLLGSVILIPLVYLLMVIQIPCRIKYGQEKSRIINIIAMMIVMIGSSLFYEVSSVMGMTAWVMTLLLMIIVMVLIYAIYRISIKIVEEKEY